MTSIGGVDVTRETEDRLHWLVDLVVNEAAEQNLISESSIGDIWQRHIADSLQLLKYAQAGTWLDLGTGAGFPGLVIAATGRAGVHLVEERKRRAAFLEQTAATLDLSVKVWAAKLTSVPLMQVDVISARAFAPLPKLFALAYRFSHSETVWILPKGRSAAEELASVAATWQGRFRLEPSVTDPDSAIIVATNVRPIGRR